MDSFDKFYKSSLRFLSFRPRSEKELRDYLSKKLNKAKSAPGGKKLSEELISSIIEKLKEQNFLNDEEFVKWWVEQRTLIKPKAARIIKMELKQKGIKEELIELILGEGKKGDFEKAIKLAEKRMPRYSRIEEKRKVYEKLGRFLASKGFDYDTIKEAIDQIFTKEYN